MMNVMKTSILLSVLLVLSVVADPTVEIPKVDKKEVAIGETITKVAEILESAYGSMASVRDDKSLAESGVKLGNLAKEMLALEPNMDMTKKPNNKITKEVALRFLKMNEKVKKEMEDVKKLKLDDRLVKLRDEQFKTFWETVAPVKKKMNTLFPPGKLAYFITQIKAEEAARALHNKDKKP